MKAGITTSLLLRLGLLLFLTPAVRAANPPAWAADAVWYQIFPERFHNGDPENDPTIESLRGTWPWEDQTWWEVSRWTLDWYAFQPWEEANGQPFNYQFQLRRYGGDLQGILDKLDYLQELGVNALYLNPVFDSPSSHKYGAAMYRHIDRHFGPDPQGDTEIIAGEDPADPATWRWTAADTLFLKLVREVHRRGMKIIIDGVFNHVGLTFWAFQDVIRHREDSPYYGWFNIKGSGLPDHSHLNEYQTLPDYFLEPGDPPLHYAGYVADLPAFRQDELGPVPPVREHLRRIVSRWMDPNGDGDPSDGIDGWRIDVAERLQIRFWDRFCGWVKAVNPDAYVTGEVWWEDWWNNRQFNAAPWLTETRFDAVMNYRFGDAMFKFFIDREQAISATELDQQLGQIRRDYRPETAFALQNCLDSHDMERLASAVVNPDRWMDHANNLQYNREFDIRKPNADERRVQKVILAFQFTYPGAPYIYYGDEAGMWGADDPDCRKPMVWPEFVYDDEVAHPCDRLPDCDYSRPRDRVAFDRELFDYYRSLIQLRRDHPALRRGTYRTVLTDDANRLFAFERTYQDERIRAVFNGSWKAATIPPEVLGPGIDNWELIFGADTGNTLEGKSAKIYLRR
jgi:glycosidase